VLAARVAACLRPGDAVLLEGPLGAGKTAFARALLRSATGDAALDVPSPSYTLVQSYDSPLGPIHHFDLWRLDGPGALAELGWEEARAAIVLVEWPDRLGALRPHDALHIALQLAAPLPEDGQPGHGHSGYGQPEPGQPEPGQPGDEQYRRGPSGDGMMRLGIVSGWADRLGDLQ
jgi:tRNA threonylcarbamoyladenosine biosynthesis protein TsaE